MKLAVMQPYFLPYIGYWQLINAVDTFVIYDNVQYTKKGWINRNRFLLNGKDKMFTVNLRKDSDYLNVDQRFLSHDYKKDKLIAMFHNAYYKACNYNEVIKLIIEIINCKEEDLFKYIYNSVIKICEYLSINTKIIISSSVNIDHSLKAQSKVIALCKQLNVQTYINAIGGVELYNKDDFLKNNIKLQFLKTKPIEYKQYNNEFIPNLSILDVMMFNSPDKIKIMLQKFEIL